VHCHAAVVTFICRFHAMAAKVNELSKLISSVLPVSQQYRLLDCSLSISDLLKHYVKSNLDVAKAS